MLSPRLQSSLALLIAFLAAEPAGAQTPEQFYRGKQINFIVGYPAGSGYDVYARLLASHLGRHIPGQPTIVAQNMPAAGSLGATNYLYARAPRDGTVIGAINRSVLLAPLLQSVGDDSLRFDALKFTWLGSMSKEFTIGFVWSASGVTSFDDLHRRKVTTGTAAVTADGSGRENDREITLFKQNADQGVGYMALAKLIIDKGQAAGIGTPL